MIVFAAFIHTVDGIEGHLKKEGLDYAKVTGNTPSGERDKIFRSFQQTSRVRTSSWLTRSAWHTV